MQRLTAAKTLAQFHEGRQFLIKEQLAALLKNMPSLSYKQLRVTDTSFYFCASVKKDFILREKIFGYMCPYFVFLLVSHDGCRR